MEESRERMRFAAAVCAVFVMVIITVFVIAGFVLLGEKEQRQQREAEASAQSENYKWFTRENLPDGAEVLETASQYRFRRYEYATGLSSPELNGWELYNTNTVWSEEIETTSDSFIKESDPEMIRYREVTKTEIIDKVQYNYKHYRYYNENSEKVYTYTEARGGGEWEYLVLSYELPQGKMIDDRRTRVDEDGVIWFKAGVNKEGEITENETVTQVESPYTVYYFQVASKTYDFRRWGDWSTWSFKEVKADERTETESRKVYKVKI